MRHLGRVLGMTVAVFGSSVLYGCHAPPPAAAIANSPAPPPRLAASINAEIAPLTGSTAPPPAAAASGGAGKIWAPYRPPPRRAEIPPPAPSPQALWEPGHWRWNGTRYVWWRGRYLERPQPDANWIPGYWQQEADGWTWVEGRWS
jgi:hypothetical protein